MTRLKVQKAEPLRLEYENIVEALRTDTLPSVTGEDGLAVLKVAYQLIASTYTHRASTQEQREIVAGEA